jgi:hypothetical protein
MNIDGFMRNLIGLKIYMIVDKSIVTIGISGISGHVESKRKEGKGTT